MQTHVALIRAIGPVTHAKMPMAALRAACVAAGFADVSTHLATGNLIFRSAEPADRLALTLRRIVDDFDLNNRVFLRRPADLIAVRDTDPFPDATRERPSQVIACFVDGGVPDLDWFSDHTGPERIAVIGTALVVDYPGDVSKSRLVPGTIERRIGLPMTFRNWSTLVRLTRAAATLRAPRAKLPARPAVLTSRRLS